MFERFSKLSCKGTIILAYCQSVKSILFCLIFHESMSNQILFCEIFQKKTYFLHKTFDRMKKNTEIWALNKKLL
jgi:hypothetical protein